MTAFPQVPVAEASPATLAIYRQAMAAAGAGSPAGNNLPPRWVVARWVKEFQKDFKEADLEVRGGGGSAKIQ